MNLEYKFGDGLYIHVPNTELNLATVIVKAALARLRELGVPEDGEDIKYLQEICMCILKEYFDGQQSKEIQ